MLKMRQTLNWSTVQMIPMGHFMPSDHRLTYTLSGLFTVDFGTMTGLYVNIFVMHRFKIKTSTYVEHKHKMWLNMQILQYLPKCSEIRLQGHYGERTQMRVRGSYYYNDHSTYPLWKNMWWRDTCHVGTLRCHSVRSSEDGFHCIYVSSATSLQDILTKQNIMILYLLNV